MSRSPGGNRAFPVSIEDGRLIGVFQAPLIPPISSAFMDLSVTEHRHTSLSKRSREVVILTVGAVWQAPYELYAHGAVGRQVGLSEDEVRTLADGGRPESLTDAETVAHRVARALSIEHRVDEALYREAAARLGVKGIMGAVILTGIYHSVCNLNTFEVPVPS